MSGARLLIVEDEPHILRPLVDYFRGEGYEVDAAKDGEAALRLAAEAPPDCVVLDVMLPKKDGIAVCRELRARLPLLPIILLTARASEGDRILGLEAGADDYVIKPFGVLELNARVRAQLRRRRRTDEALREGGARQGASDAVVRFGDEVVVDLEKRSVTRRGADVKLSAMELKLLEHLLGREGAVLPRNELLDQVWGYERFPSTRTVDTHVWKLRQKLERDPEQPEHLLTVHGIGYRFVLTPN